MEQVTGFINEILLSWGFSQSWADDLTSGIILVVILAIAFLGDAICRHIILTAVARLVKKTKATWDDIVFDRKVLTHVSHLVAPILLYILLPLAISNLGLLSFIQRICMIYIIAVFLKFISSLLTALFHVYSEKEQFRDRPLKGLLQTVQVILFFIGGIIIVSILIDKSPMVLLTGLGASAAVLMLVFKDSIMGFVSGIQLSANNMLRVGDWIQKPKYGADGTVIEVTLNTVKVRNWDNTITTIPPYALVSDSFQNWRGMQESGGRRIKRSIRIDMNSVKFCTPEMLAKYKKIQLLKDYIEETEKVIEDYNKEHGIDNSILVDLTCMVRQLQPTEQGIPLELYFFSAIKAWVPYEGVQADVFDHVLAIIPEFDLHVFQNPTGEDFRELSKRN